MFSFLSRPIRHAAACLYSLIRKVFIIITNFVSLFLFSLITAAIIQWACRSNFVEHDFPLDFIFKTCATELSGVCSFPESEIALGSDEMELQPKYYYSFALDLQLFDTPQNRQLLLVMASVNLKDEFLQTIKSFHKSIPIFRAFSSRSIFYRMYSLARNVCFWPLYFLGFFDESEMSDVYIVKFPSYFHEHQNRPTKFISVQLQSRHIQLSSGSLRIRTNLSYLSFFLNEFPIFSFFVLCIGVFVIYFIILIIILVIYHIFRKFRRGFRR